MKYITLIKCLFILFINLSLQIVRTQPIAGEKSGAPLETFCIDPDCFTCQNNGTCIQCFNPYVLDENSICIISSNTSTASAQGQTVQTTTTNTVNQTVVQNTNTTSGQAGNSSGSPVIGGAVIPVVGQDTTTQTQNQTVTTVTFGNQTGETPFEVKCVDSNCQTCNTNGSICISCKDLWNINNGACVNISSSAPSSIVDSGVSLGDNTQAIPDNIEKGGFLPTSIIPSTTEASTLKTQCQDINCSQCDNTGKICQTCNLNYRIQNDSCVLDNSSLLKSRGQF